MAPPATLETIQQNAEKEEAKKEELRAKAKRESEMQLTNAAIASSLRGTVFVNAAVLRKEREKEERTERKKEKREGWGKEERGFGILLSAPYP